MGECSSLSLLSAGISVCLVFLLAGERGDFHPASSRRLTWAAATTAGEVSRPAHQAHPGAEWARASVYPAARQDRRPAAQRSLCWGCWPQVTLCPCGKPVSQVCGPTCFRSRASRGKEGPGQLSLGPGRGGPALTLWCLPAGSAWSQPLSGPEKHSGGLLKGVPGFGFEVSTLCGLHSRLRLGEVWGFPWNRSVEEGLQWGPQAFPVMLPHTSWHGAPLSGCPTPAHVTAMF